MISTVIRFQVYEQPLLSPIHTKSPFFHFNNRNETIVWNNLLSYLQCQNTLYKIHMPMLMYVCVYNF